jgi:hypothetical protein
MADIAGALTDSLSRSGDGGMLVPFANLDGDVALPGMTWALEPSTGFYRESNNDMQAGVAGARVTRWFNDSATANGEQNPFQIWDGLAWRDAIRDNHFGPVSFQGNLAVGGTLGVTGATTLAALSATTGNFNARLTALSLNVTHTAGVLTNHIIGGISGVSNGFIISQTAGNALSYAFYGGTGGGSALLSSAGALTLSAGLTATTGAFSGNVSVSDGILSSNVSGAGTALDISRDAGAAGRLTVNFNGANANFDSASGGYTFSTASASNALSIAAAGAATFSSSASVDNLQFTQNSSASGATEAIYRPTTGSIAFKLSGIERVRLNANGFLGVGTTTPNYKIVASNAGAEGIEFAPAISGNVNMTLHYNRATSVYTTNRQIASVHEWRIGAGAASMTHDASGDLGLLAASGSRWVRNTSLSLAVNEQAGFQAQATRAGGSARTATMSVFKHSGIAEAAGYLFLQPQNGVVYYYWTGDDGKFRVGQAAGNIGTNGGSVVGDQTSDETLKNIEVGFEYGIDEVMRMRPIAYSMKDDLTNKRMLGFGAQTTRPIIPELVYDTGDCLDGYDVDLENEMIQTPRSGRNKLAMEYIQAVPVLVNAMQQQQAMIEALTQRIESLEPA